MFHPFAVFIAGGNDVYPCRVNTAVTENICKLGNVLFNAVKNTSEQVAQIVRKYFLWIYPRLLAKPFHLPPDIRATYWFACSCNENCT